MRANKMFPALFAISLLGAPAFARPQSGPGKPPAAAKHKGAQGQAKAGQREARILEALKKEGIDEARAKRVVDVVKKARAEGKTVHEQMRTHREALKNLLSTSSTDENAYAKALDGLKAGKKKLAEIQERQVTEIQKILKPSEQAKVLRLLVRHRGRGKA